MEIGVGGLGYTVEGGVGEKQRQKKIPDGWDVADEGKAVGNKACFQGFQLEEHGNY